MQWRQGCGCFIGRLENNCLNWMGIPLYYYCGFQDTDKAKMLAREHASDDNDKMVGMQPPPRHRAEKVPHHLQYFKERQCVH
jgi:hypothetical protein